MKIRWLLLLSVLPWTVGAQGRGPLDLATAPVPSAALRIPYGSDALQFGELRLPSARGPHPVAIVVHGGCWVAKLGDMDSRAVALDNMRGHLAMWLAARPKLTSVSDLFTGNPLRLSGVVDLDGPADLKATIAVQQPICGRPVITDLLGGSPQERPERYRDGSPIELLPLGVPQSFFAGAMFASQVAPYEEAVKRAGDALRTHVRSKAGHFVFIDPQSDVWPEVLSHVRRLLKICN